VKLTYKLLTIKTTTERTVPKNKRAITLPRILKTIVIKDARPNPTHVLELNKTNCVLILVIFASDIKFKNGYL